MKTETPKSLQEMIDEREKYRIEYEKKQGIFGKIPNMMVSEKNALIEAQTELEKWIEYYHNKTISEKLPSNDYLVKMLAYREFHGGEKYKK